MSHRLSDAYRYQRGAKIAQIDARINTSFRLDFSVQVTPRLWLAEFPGGVVVEAAKLFAIRDLYGAQ